MFSAGPIASSRSLSPPPRRHSPLPCTHIHRRCGGLIKLCSLLSLIFHSPSHRQCSPFFPNHYQCSLSLLVLSLISGALLPLSESLLVLSLILRLIAFLSFLLLSFFLLSVFFLLLPPLLLPPLSSSSPSSSPLSLSPPPSPSHTQAVRGLMKERTFFISDFWNVFGLVHRLVSERALRESLAQFLHSD